MGQGAISHIPQNSSGFPLQLANGMCREPAWISWYLYPFLPEENDFPLPAHTALPPRSAHPTHVLQPTSPQCFAGEATRRREVSGFQSHREVCSGRTPPRSWAPPEIRCLSINHKRKLQREALRTRNEWKKCNLTTEVLFYK